MEGLHVVKNRHRIEDLERKVEQLQSDTVAIGIAFLFTFAVILLICFLVIKPIMHQTHLAMIPVKREIASEIQSARQYSERPLYVLGEVVDNFNSQIWDCLCLVSDVCGE